LGKASRRHRRDDSSSGSRPTVLTDYRHVQAGTMLIALFSIPFAICMASAITHPNLRGFQIGICVALAVLMLLFSSLTTAVTDTTLSWNFGYGFIRKHIDIREIDSAEMTRSTWIDGWGIHYTRRGWIYNVSGFDAILVKQKNGKSILIGTNNPVGLWEALQLRLDR
jgi:hypothetical protein